MRKVLALSALGAVALSTSAQAEGWYAGFELGQGRIDNETSEVANEIVAAVGGTVLVRQDVAEGVGRINVGKSLNENVAFEVGYFMSRQFELDISGSSRSIGAYAFSGDVEGSGIDLSVVLRPSEASGFSGFHVKLGAQHSKLEGSLRSPTLGIDMSDDMTGSGYLYGAGYDWNLGDAFLRLAATQYAKLAGESDSDITFYSLGYAFKF